MTEDFIRKYLTGGLTGSEERELRKWLEEDKTNRRVFENMVAEWHLEPSQIERSRKKVYTRLTGTGEGKVKGRSFLPYFLKIAATVAIVATAVWVLMNAEGEKPDEILTSGPVQVEKHALYGQKITLKLPDGSMVTLNSGSKLIAPDRFEGDAREVSLTGEAFFDVARDTSKPFVIHAGELTVQVLGTSFNVRTYADEDDISVAVLSGKVSVSGGKTQDEHFLLPDEMLSYYTKEELFSQKKDFDKDLILGWKDQHLVFQDESIGNILKTLSRWYDVDFDIDAGFDARKPFDQQKGFTGKFRNSTLNQVLESVAYNYRFEYEINGKVVKIY